MPFITFMGIPITNTLSVMAALNAFIEDRVGVLYELEDGFDEVSFFSPDEWEKFPMTEPVSWRSCVRDEEDMRRHRGNRVGVRKPKAVK